MRERPDMSKWRIALVLIIGIVLYCFVSMVGFITFAYALNLFSGRLLWNPPSFGFFEGPIEITFFWDMLPAQLLANAFVGYFWGRVLRKEKMAYLIIGLLFITWFGILSHILGTSVSPDDPSAERSMIILFSMPDIAGFAVGLLFAKLGRRPVRKNIEKTIASANEK